MPAAPTLIAPANTQPPRVARAIWPFLMKSNIGAWRACRKVPTRFGVKKQGTPLSFQGLRGAIL
jgi:hypothetical protein